MESAAKMSLQSVRVEDDPDLAAYLTQLRDTLIDCYVTIVHGVANSQAQQNLVNYAPSIIKYLCDLYSPMI